VRRRSVSAFGCILAALALSHLVLPELPGQSATGDIQGTVLDTSGAVIAGAIVKLTNTGTGFTRTVTTNDRGDYRAPLMPLGTYEITAEYAGFQSKVVRGITLQVDQTAVIRIELAPGTVTETVAVTAATPLLESQESSLGQVIENKRILELPLNGRNPFQLGLLAGGVTPFRGLSTNLPFTAGGGRHSGNDLMLDGVDNNIRNYNGSTGRNGVNYIPSVDAVQEFKVKTSTFSAEYGRSAGYTVNATIRSGTNQYHGSAFEFLRNDKLDANNFVSNFTGNPKAKFRQNQFGGTFGGPVRLPGYDGRNRTFFFADYQGTQVREAAGSSLSDVAPEAFRAGDFSAANRVIYDPRTRRIGPNGVVTAEPFPNNTVPRSMMDPVALKLQELIPLPNTGAPGQTSRNFFTSSPRETHWNQGDIKVDQRLWDGNNLMARVSISRLSQPNQGIFIYSPSSRLQNLVNAVVSDTHVFSPRVVNEFRFGFNRANSSNVALRADESTAFAAANGLQSGAVIGFPRLNFNYSGEKLGTTQFSEFTAALSNLIFENTFHWVDNLTIIRGNHTFKTGAEARRLRFDRLREVPFSADYVFGAVFTANPSASGQTGLPYAEFLLGMPTSVVGDFLRDWGRQRDLYAGVFLQDDWKVTPRLTLNLGLRYDLYTQPVDALDNGGVFDPNLAGPTGRFGVIRRPGKDGNTRAVVEGDHNNFAPRFGFAYQMTPRFVIRGGYGIFYSLREQNDEATLIGDTVLNFALINMPQVNPQTTVTPPIRFTTPVNVVSAVDPFFSAFDAEHPLSSDAGSANAPDIGNSKNPMLQQFNLSLQYEFTPGLLVEGSYAGARGIRWVQRVNVNQVRFEDALAGRNRIADRPFPFINSAIGIDTANVNNWYNSFNLRVERRFSQGLTFLANYTFSKNVDSGNSGTSTFASQNNVVAMDTYNLWRERGLSPTDVPHKFVLSALYELPFGPGRPFLNNGVPAAILGGWQVNGILSLVSGFPTEMNVTSLPPVQTLRNRPDVVLGQPTRVENPSFDQFFNPKAFALPPRVPDHLGAPIQTFGNAGRNIIRGPGSRNLDFSVFKSFRTSESTSLQFRAEAFNLSNTPTFILPSARSAALTVGNENFGKLAGSGSVGRQLQFGLKFLF
jgi:hypothetical protein